MNKILQFTNAIALVVPLTLTAGSGSSSDAALVTSARIVEAIKSMPVSAAVDQPLRTVDVGIANVGIFLVHRPQEADQGCTIEHDTLFNDNTTSVFFVLDGAGTLVTGGTLTNPTPLSSADPDLKLVGKGSRGTGIRNGESRHIKKGDIVVIPAGVPHGFSAIDKSITYEVVRIDSGKILPVK
jgi:mannose-6-phosphate isomerase-like protein (cupin superfamily)